MVLKTSLSKNKWWPRTSRVVGLTSYDIKKGGFTCIWISTSDHLLEYQFGKSYECKWLVYGCFPKNSGEIFPPKKKHFKKRVFHYVHHPFLGHPYFWKHPKTVRIPRLGVPHLQRRAGTTRGLYLGVHRPVGAESFRDGVTTLGLRGVTRNPLREGRNRREQRRVGWGLENDSPIFFIGVFM